MTAFSFPLNTLNAAQTVFWAVPMTVRAGWLRSRSGAACVVSNPLRALGRAGRLWVTKLNRSGALLAERKPLAALRFPAASGSGPNGGATTPRRKLSPRATTPQPGGASKNGRGSGGGFAPYRPNTGGAA